ncbi:MAG: alpha/beta hydrolase [Cyanobacteria bacterium J06623_4]
MKSEASLLWISVSPFLKAFDKRLLAQLAGKAAIRRWEYVQAVDEPCCLDAIVEALHAYVRERADSEKSSYQATGRASSKLHLLGHGTSGVVALLYARRYPQQVASLTLLSVSAEPGVNWQAHYYALRQLLPCNRQRLLSHMSRLLLGKQSPRFAQALAQLLAKDLDSNLTLHSLGHDIRISTGGTPMPLLVCNGEIDSIVCSQQQLLWQTWMKPSDRLWHCPEGKHFFHYYYPEVVAEKILEHISKTTTDSLTESYFQIAQAGCVESTYRHEGLSTLLNRP